MKSNSKIIKFANFGFLALVILFVGYMTYGKLKESELDKRSSRKEMSAVANTKNVLSDSIVDFGMKYLGTPYVAAGCTADGFDCSGFVYFVFKHFNIEVPRSSSGFENFGKEIPIDKVKRGDLLLFLSPTRNAIGHIGIVTKSNGKQSDFIHATSGREMKVVISSLASEGYTRRLVKAVRVTKP